MYLEETELDRDFILYDLNKRSEMTGSLLSTAQMPADSGNETRLEHSFQINKKTTLSQHFKRLKSRHLSEIQGPLTRFLPVEFSGLNR